MLAQVTPDPMFSPTLNNGGWVYNAAVLLAVVGVLITLIVVFGYMRFAPRFQADGSGPRRVRSPRIQPGQDVRRPVNVTSAPLVVQPPLVAAVATAPAPATTPTPAPAAAAAPAPAPPRAPAAPAETPPAAAPAEPAPAEATPVQAEAAPAPAAGEHKEVALDQETFDAKLAELLEKGTDRRVAEGQARRAAMIAARKKAGG